MDPDPIAPVDPTVPGVEAFSLSAMLTTFFVATGVLLLVFGLFWWLVAPRVIKAQWLCRAALVLGPTQCALAVVMFVLALMTTGTAAAAPFLIAPLALFVACAIPPTRRALARFIRELRAPETAPPKYPPQGTRA